MDRRVCDSRCGVNQWEQGPANQYGCTECRCLQRCPEFRRDECQAGCPGGRIDTSAVDSNNCPRCQCLDSQGMYIRGPNKRSFLLLAMLNPPLAVEFVQMLHVCVCFIVASSKPSCFSSVIICASV